jgi:hypothetical protein
MPGRKPDELIRPTVEERIGADRQNRARLLGEGRECSIDLALVARGQYAVPGRDHNGDSRCSGLGRKPCHSAARRRDDGNLAAYQIGGQR